MNYIGQDDAAVGQNGTPTIMTNTFANSAAVLEKRSACVICTKCEL